MKTIALLAYSTVLMFSGSLDRSKPAYAAWLLCLSDGAHSLSHSPDSAEDVARAAMAICRVEEAHARAEQPQIDDEDWSKNRQIEHELALSEVVRHRAMRALGQHD